ncbi:PDR/VanB family oxidoreductase [Rhodococcus sp. O3]|uniref:PDR/VanB family oxidoreductase n=1 Tax=Rhodococcus sp. O3 TaxID=3404919 RepID=UPI003B673347
MDLELCVVARRLVADSVVELTLALPEGGDLPCWEPGAHIDLHVGDLVRQYSLTGLETTPDTWTVAVLREPNSRGGSDYIHDRLVEDSRVVSAGPRNHFAFRPGNGGVLFVAGGIGITPLLPMIARADEAGTDWRLVYLGRARTGMAYIDDLVKYGDRVEVRPDDEYGLPDVAALIAATAPDTSIYACGPEGLLSALESVCSSAESPRPLRLERFVPKVVETDGPENEFEVEFAQSGLTVLVPANRSILQIAEEAGVVIISSCSEGTCGTCETAVLDGTPDHRDSVLTADEQESGMTIMPCVSRSRTPKLVLDV